MQHDSWTPAGGRLTGRVLSWLVFAVVAGWCHQGHAQWITQTNALKPGWNAVYLHVDASHTNLNSLIDANVLIDEVWLWSHDLPPGLSLATPPDPTTTPASQWSKWTKEDTNSVLQTLPGNAALLVKASTNFAWQVKGRPVAPSYRWTLTGLNFVGFPTATPTNPDFDAFLAPAAQALDWKQSSEIFRYQGGNLGPTNPIAVSPIFQRSVPVVRDQAYWIRAGEPTNQIYNHYFGPFQVTGGGSSGIRFGDAQSQARLYLKNMTKSNLTVTLREIASEVPPTGTAPPILPLMVRGPINTTNLTFGYSSLTAGTNWTLAPHGQPGSEEEIVLGVDRSQMSGVAGRLFAGVLQFTDSFGLTRVEIGASATTPSRDGLWVGNAVVDQVSQYLKPYAKATNVANFHQRLNVLVRTVGSPELPVATNAAGYRYEWNTNTGRILVFGGPGGSKGRYLEDGPVQQELDDVARPFPLRLIVHHDGTTSRLLQRAYLGQDSSSNQVVAARQSALLAGDLANARRLSAVHLPTTDGLSPWTLVGEMQAGSDLVTTVQIPYGDQSSNPFLHTYHPDHDNLDNRDGKPLPSGKESYDLWREMRLSFTAPGNDFDSRTQSGTSLRGNYEETISLRSNSTELRQFKVLGTFGLNRITDTANYAP